MPGDRVSENFETWSAANDDHGGIKTTDGLRPRSARGKIKNDGQPDASGVSQNRRMTRKPIKEPQALPTTTGVAPGTVNDPEKLARICKVLSVDTRVRMIDMLKERSLCVNALARFLNVTPAAVSQHLRVLRDAEVVIADKQGYFVHYRINPDTLAVWNEAVGRLLESGE